MISRITWSAQPPMILLARLSPMPWISRKRSGVRSMTSNTCAPKACTSRLA